MESSRQSIYNIPDYSEKVREFPGAFAFEDESISKSDAIVLADDDEILNGSYYSELYSILDGIGKTQHSVTSLCRPISLWPQSLIHDNFYQSSHHYGFHVPIESYQLLHNLNIFSLFNIDYAIMGSSKPAYNHAFKLLEKVSHNLYVLDDVKARIDLCMNNMRMRTNTVSTNNSSSSVLITKAIERQQDHYDRLLPYTLSMQLDSHISIKNISPLLDINSNDDPILWLNDSDDHANLSSNDTILKSRTRLFLGLLLPDEVYEVRYPLIPGSPLYVHSPQGYESHKVNEKAPDRYMRDVKLILQARISSLTSPAHIFLTHFGHHMRSYSYYDSSIKDLHMFIENLRYNSYLLRYWIRRLSESRCYYQQMLTTIQTEYRNRVSALLMDYSCITTCFLCFLREHDALLGLAQTDMNGSNWRTAFLTLFNNVRL